MLMCSFGNTFKCFGTFLFWLILIRKKNIIYVRKSSVAIKVAGRGKGTGAAVGLGAVRARTEVGAWRQWGWER